MTSVFTRNKTSRSVADLKRISENMKLLISINSEVKIFKMFWEFLLNISELENFLVFLDLLSKQDSSLRCASDHLWPNHDKARVDKG